jgi:hemerythrin-like domain-containing protein
MENRFNIFNQVHKGLRAMLYDTALTIQHTDFSREEEGRATLRKLRQVLELYAQHGEHEDNTVFPAVKQVAPEAVALLEADHKKDEQITQDLLLLIRIYKWSVNDHERFAAGYSIHLAFQEFVAFNLQHMVKEEVTINPLLWQHYTDEQIAGIQQRILQNITPEDGVQYSRWMLQGMNDAELIAWFDKMQDTPMWEPLHQLAMNELGAERVSDLLSHNTTQAVIY